MLARDEDYTRAAAIFIPGFFDLGQRHYFRLNLQLGGHDGLHHTMNRAQHAFEWNASDTASHQYQRGRTKGCTWQCNASSARCTDLYEADGHCLLACFCGSHNQNFGARAPEIVEYNVDAFAAKLLH